MKNRYFGLIIVESIVIIFLLVGVVVLFILLNRYASAPSLPIMPTYDSVFSTTAPLPTSSPALNTNTLSPGISPVTVFPLFVLNGTPIYPASTYSFQTRIATAAPAAVWTYTPTSFVTAHPAQMCRNILYPMAVGQQWLYQVSALDHMTDLSMNVLSVSNSQGSVLVNNQQTGLSKQVQIQCDGDVIRSFPFMSADVLFGNILNSNMTASYVSGVLAPNESAFLNNNWALAWSSQYLVSGDIVINRNGTQLAVTLNNSPITLTCQTLAVGDAAFETVTVAAGTFRALKIVCSEQGQATAVMNGVSVTGLAEGRSYQWFAPNIGLVKMKMDHASIKIFDVSFSLLTNNSLELRSFIPAP